MAPVVQKACLVFGVFCVLMVLANVARWYDLALALLAAAALAAAASPELLGYTESMKLKTLETRSFIAFMTFNVFIGILLHLWQAPFFSVRLSSHSHRGWYVKVFLIPLHFSDFHFWILNSSESALWLLEEILKIVPQMPPEEATIHFLAAVNCCLFDFAITAALRYLVGLTLAEAFKEIQLREVAERARNSFLSYIMHEMRNPLSGATLLVGEFRTVLKELIHRTGTVAGASTTIAKNAVARRLIRLLRLSNLMEGQFQKMKGVCDDVLQLEKLERGGFEHVFTREDPKAWFERVAAEAKSQIEFCQQNISSTSTHTAIDSQEHKNQEQEKTPSIPPKAESLSPEAGRHSASARRNPSKTTQEKGEEKRGKTSKGEQVPPVLFEWSFEVSAQAEVQLSSRPLGVADFLRLEQVLSNFLSNAQKFTKKGRIHLKAEIRLPTEEEEDQFYNLVGVSPPPFRQIASPSPHTSGEGESKRGEGKRKEKDKGKGRGGVDRRGSRQSSRKNSKVGGSGMDSEKIISTNRSQWISDIQKIIEKEEKGDRAQNTAEEQTLDSPSYPPGKVSKHLEKENDGPLEFLVLRVSVTDSGPGLRLEDRARLFKPYVQIRSGELQNGGGTGLGLCICKSFVEAHGGGQIGVESEGPGMGSSFFFQVALPVVHATVEEQEKGKGGESEKEGIWKEIKEEKCGETSRPLKEVEVDEGEGFGQSKTDRISVFLSPPQFRSRVSRGRASLLSATIPGISRRDSQSLFLCSTATELNEQSRRHSSVLSPSSSSKRDSDIIVSDANPFRHHDQKVETAGGITSSVPGAGSQKSRTCRAVEDGWETQSVGSEDSQSRSVTEGGGKNQVANREVDVLLVDDDEFCLLAGQMAIFRLGYSLHTARDASEAVDLIVSGRHSYRLVLLDNNMAEMGGPEAVRRIVSHFNQQAAPTDSPSHPAAPEERLSVRENARGHVLPPVLLGCTVLHRRDPGSSSGTGLLESLVIASCAKSVWAHWLIWASHSGGSPPNRLATRHQTPQMGLNSPACMGARVGELIREG
uniref:histidine kinase n=1 Tax=Chromera velia CCMP2878 TaxID=1169474 RepID=A0A0G4IDE8_9ALVE|eukprot:Cvel_13390.t1-p1 / transcript=Cvel_13390.t1 / gene=Cvel_13390 / organism=Chromera_velia_CCMP2878 / gene_product=hypothetical protein / transcript_product=hypothetical protein / location=Cvel_scaffold911:56766-62376(+) / protein_length=1037 / sequence_SO=supercontig / SO=protein_coding / is_pseudo=false